MALDGGEEPRAHEHALSPEHDGGRHTSPVGDASCSQHGHRLDEVHRLRHQCHRRHGAADMTATFGALGDDHVCALGCNAAGFLRGRHLVHDLQPRLMSFRGQLRGAAPAE